MFTLKIHWTRHGNSEEPVAGMHDETTLFIPADEVKVHAHVPAGERESQMKHWDERLANDPWAPGYFNYLSVGPSGEDGGRLICVVRNGDQRWYLATAAWLLGPDGGTIERVAP